MKKISLSKFQIYSAIFASILGSILHFLYDWTNKNAFVALFSATNESTWEHLKLAFFPMLLTTIVGYFIFKKDYPSFICGKTLSIIVALSFITAFFYTYTGILGRNFAILDILSFYVAIIIGELVGYKFITSVKVCNTTLSFVILIVLLFSFLLFTYKPLYINLFKDPVTGLYGIF